jgi:hypothetical protein
MPGVRTTVINKNSGVAEIHEAKPKDNLNIQEKVDFAYLPPPCSPDEMPKLTEWFVCYKNGKVVERFVSAKMAQDYCDRGLADRWEKETIKS